MEDKSKNSNFEAPKYLTINEYKYSLKGELKNEIYSYRCFHRKCGVLLSIDKKELNKIIENPGSGESIKFISNKKLHNCGKELITEAINNIKTETKSIDLAIKLINNQIDMPLSWHIENLKKNNLIFTKAQIKNFLQEQREINYESDKEFLSNIANITISFSEKEIYLQDLPFCFTYQKHIKKIKQKLIEEKFIVFTTDFQLKKMKNIDHLYMDGTFKYCPKNFYQIFNILGIDNNTSKKIPLFYILMNTKSYTLYYHVFSYIKNLISSKEIKIKFEDINFTCDFEKSLRKALIEIFPKSNIYGCYFHYVKALWKKAKKHGIRTKKFLKETIVLIFSFKIYQYIPRKDKKVFLQEIENIYKNKNEYSKFIVNLLNTLKKIGPIRIF